MFGSLIFCSRGSIFVDLNTSPTQAVLPSAHELSVNQVGLTPYRVKRLRRALL